MISEDTTHEFLRRGWGLWQLLALRHSEVRREQFLAVLALQGNTAGRETTSLATLKWCVFSLWRCDLLGSNPTAHQHILGLFSRVEKTPTKIISVFSYVVLYVEWIKLNSGFWLQVMEESEILCGVYRWHWRDNQDGTWDQFWPLFIWQTT